MRLGRIVKFSRPRIGLKDLPGIGKTVLPLIDLRDTDLHRFSPAVLAAPKIDFEGPVRRQVPIV